MRYLENKVTTIRDAFMSEEYNVINSGFSVDLAKQALLKDMTNA